MNNISLRSGALSQQSKKNGRNFIWNTFGVSLYTVNSLFFLIAVTRLSRNSLSDAGVFALAYTSANIFLAISLYGVRAYQVTDIENRYSNGDYCATRIVTCAVSFVLAIAFTAISRYDLYKCTIMLTLTAAKAIEGFSDVYFGVLQRHDRLDVVGKAYTLKSIIGLLAFLCLLLFSHSLVLACVSLLLIDLAVLFLYERRFAFQVDTPYITIVPQKIRSLLIACFPVFIVSTLSLFLQNVPRYVLDHFMTSADQGIYAIIAMPAMTITLFTTFIVQFFLSIFAKIYANKDRFGFFRIVSIILLLIFAVTVLFEVLCYFFGIWILMLLYHQNMSAHLMQLLAINLGAAFLSGALVFCTALTTIRITQAQMYIYIMNAVFAVCVSIPLVQRLGITGAALAFDLIALFQFLGTGIVFFGALFRKKNF